MRISNFLNNNLIFIFRYYPGQPKLRGGKVIYQEKRLKQQSKNLNFSKKPVHLVFNDEGIPMETEPCKLIGKVKTFLKETESDSSAAENKVHSTYSFPDTDTDGVSSDLNSGKHPTDACFERYHKETNISDEKLIENEVEIQNSAPPEEETGLLECEEYSEALVDVEQQEEVIDDQSSENKDAVLVPSG